MLEDTATTEEDQSTEEVEIEDTSVQNNHTSSLQSFVLPTDDRSIMHEIFSPGNLYRIC